MKIKVTNYFLKNGRNKWNNFNRISKFYTICLYKKIIDQMQKNICKIKIEEEQGTGFFCKMPFPTKEKI